MGGGWVVWLCSSWCVMLCVLRVCVRFKFRFSGVDVAHGVRVRISDVVVYLDRWNASREVAFSLWRVEV